MTDYGWEVTLCVTLVTHGSRANFTELKFAVINTISRLNKNLFPSTFYSRTSTLTSELGHKMSTLCSMGRSLGWLSYEPFDGVRDTNRQVMALWAPQRYRSLPPALRTPRVHCAACTPRPRLGGHTTLLAGSVCPDGPESPSLSGDTDAPTLPALCPCRIRLRALETGEKRHCYF